MPGYGRLLSERLYSRADLMSKTRPPECCNVRRCGYKQDATLPSHHEPETLTTPSEHVNELSPGFVKSWAAGCRLGAALVCMAIGIPGCARPNAPTAASPQGTATPSANDTGVNRREAEAREFPWLPVRWADHDRRLRIRNDSTKRPVPRSIDWTSARAKILTSRTPGDILADKASTTEAARLDQRASSPTLTHRGAHYVRRTSPRPEEVRRDDEIPELATMCVSRGIEGIDSCGPSTPLSCVCRGQEVQISDWQEVTARFIAQRRRRTTRSPSSVGYYFLGCTCPGIGFFLTPFATDVQFAP